MLKAERQRLILEQLQTQGTVRVDHLAAHFEVNPVTIRRDLNDLEHQGCLRRVHGGAVLEELPPAPATGTDVERRMAEAAANFLPNQSVVFLGPGTLTAAIVPFLTSHTHLTIITNALNTAWRLAQQQQHTLHLLGGQVESDYGAYGESDALRRVRVDWIVIEADGLDAERGLTHGEHAFASLARALFQLSAQVMVLVPPERLGRAGALFIAPASEVDILITGREAENPPLWDLSELGVRIVLT